LQFTLDDWLPALMHGCVWLRSSPAGLRPGGTGVAAVGTGASLLPRFIN
jgi:hypothetical protein